MIGQEGCKQHFLQPSDTDNAGATAELPGEWRPHCRWHLVRKSTLDPQVKARLEVEAIPVQVFRRGTRAAAARGGLAERSNKCDKDG